VTTRPVPARSARSEEAVFDLKKHDHGQMYRLKIAPIVGPPAYGDWCGTETDVRAAMRSMARNLGERYYCETKRITCAECDAEEPAKVISSL